MPFCEICGTEIEESDVLCPKCELRLILAKKTKKKKRPIKKVKLYIMAASYILFVVFLITYLNISSYCFESNDIKCFNLSFIFLGLFACFCFIAAVLVGEEIPKWKNKN